MLLLDNYLSGRYQFVEMSSGRSNMGACPVPQGFILAPLLLSIYTYHIVITLQYVEYYLYIIGVGRSGAYVEQNIDITIHNTRLLCSLYYVLQGILGCKIDTIVHFKRYQNVYKKHST